jgi:hypothetical protein
VVQDCHGHLVAKQLDGLTGTAAAALRRPVPLAAGLAAVAAAARLLLLLPLRLQLAGSGTMAVMLLNYRHPSLTSLPMVNGQEVSEFLIRPTPAVLKRRSPGPGCT